MGNQWVQHKSGQGEKWELAIQTGIEDSHIWAVKYPGKMLPVYFPKSEYILCDPPEQWYDATHEFEVTKDGRMKHQSGHWPLDVKYQKHDGLHNGPHFLVMRKKS